MGKGSATIPAPEPIPPPVQVADVSAAQKSSEEAKKRRNRNGYANTLLGIRPAADKQGAAQAPKTLLG